MFIITLWDIGAVIFFLVCIVIALKTWIESNINAKQYERKKEPKPEPKPEPKKELEHGPNDKYAYFLLAVFIIAVAIVFIAMANSPSQ